MLGIYGLLTWLSHHEYMMMLVILMVSLAGVLLFVGNLFAIVYAFGQSIWWGVSVYSSRFSASFTVSVIGTERHILERCSSRDWRQRV